MMYTVTKQKLAALRKLAESADEQLVEVGMIDRNVVVDVDNESPALLKSLRKCAPVNGDVWDLIGFEPAAVDMALFMAEAQRSTLANGYHQASFGDHATKNIAWDAAVDRMRMDNQATPVEAEYAERLRTWAWSMLLTRGGEFWEKTSKVLANDSLRRDQAGFVACLPNMMAKDDAVIAEQARVQAFTGNNVVNDDYAPAAVNTKVEVDGLVDHVAGYGTDYGYMTVLAVRGADGYLYVWKTTSSVGAVNKGDHIVIRGTVKGHEEYRGVCQTMLTRCKVEFAKEDKR